MSSVCIIKHEDGTPVAVVETRALARAIVKKHPKYSWDCYAVHIDMSHF